MKILDKSNNNILKIEKEQADRMLRYPDRFELVEEKIEEKTEKKKPKKEDK